MHFIGLALQVETFCFRTNHFKLYSRVLEHARFYVAYKAVTPYKGGDPFWSSIHLHRKNS